MAIPIRSIPVLEGEVAERFLREAHQVEQKPRKLAFSEDIRQLVRQANEDLRKYYSGQHE
jgi:hypothetical protein